ncbi:MAG: hypothetical protein E4H14_02420 [Candidatus Thorarchaeota archaeon]|nr:MAG: hypothetical protein E4H14_02420 [Candidatus Thorarchaeota archaeon]
MANKTFSNSERYIIAAALEQFMDNQYELRDEADHRDDLWSSRAHDAIAGETGFILRKVKDDNI